MNPYQNKWAIITGASSGIGAAFAQELAADGANLILTARRADRLEALAEELRKQGATVRTHPADLSNPADIEQLYAATKDLPVEILINNAGLGQYGAFVSGDIAQELQQIRINCESVVHLARLFVPDMTRRGRGWMLVTASTASCQPVPYLATYAATKSFDRRFAEALAAEVAASGVKVTALCPGSTESEFFEVSGAMQFRRNLQSARDVARKGLDGMARGKRVVIPYRGGYALELAGRILPGNLLTRFIEKAARPK